MWLEKKVAYYEELVEFQIPHDPKVEMMAEELIEEYRQYMEGSPVTDLLLAAYLKKYAKLYLLTRDHADFPTSVFDRRHVFVVESMRDIKAYGVYAYKTKKDEDGTSGKTPF